MKRCSIALMPKVAMLSIGMALPLLAAAQSIIEKTDLPYVVKPEIQFVIDVPKQNTAGQSDVLTFVVETPKPAAPLPPPEVAWAVVSGSYLRDTLQEWSAKAGWSFVWGLSETEDFRLEAANVYVGDFKDGVRDLINALPARVRIHAELRPDNTPPLLHITRNEEGQK